MESIIPVTIDTRCNTAVRSSNGDLVCVADSKEHAEFIMRACNASIAQATGMAEVQIEA